jgi:hypothetical protein
MRLARYGLYLVAIATVTFAWIQVVDRLRSPRPIPPLVTPSAIAWGDRVFASREQLATWLRTRGLSYERWAELHPAAASVIEPGRAPTERRATPARQRTVSLHSVASDSVESAAVGSAANASRASSAASSAAASLRSSFPALVLTLATLLALAASIPASFARRRVETKTGRAIVLAAEHRYNLFGGALALALGILVGSL